MHEPLYSADEMRAAEARYPGYPGTADELMERAAAAVAAEALRAFPDARRFAVVCGKGANGGDGRIAARLLREAGRDAEETDDLSGADVVVDALFGTGFRGAPRPGAAALIERIEDSGLPVLSVDLPSGVDASTGEVAAAAVSADVTVTFHGAKVGLAVAPGRFHAGRVVVADIGLDPAATSIVRATPAIALARPAARHAGLEVHGGLAPRRGRRGRHHRRRGAHGDRSAPRGRRLRDPRGAGRGAPRGGVAGARAGEARLRVHASALDTLGPDLARASALAIGPGLGRSDDARTLVRSLLERSTLPAVVDADGLFGLSPVARDAATVLTPHAGELARLLDSDSAWVSAHRLEAAARCADRFGAVVVLKGADTIVRAPDGRTIVCDVGPPSLATAGTGDVLTGVLGAFLAKGLDATDAAVAAAIAHGLAARAVPHQPGLIASDVVAALPSVLS